jgi:aspartokinase-like uncharacterized kinase
VTSDSIAAWFARTLHVRRLLLVKHADGYVGPLVGRERVPARRRRLALDAFAGVVDPYFPRALDPATGCWIASGRRPHRIARLIETGRTHRTDAV